MPNFEVYKRGQARPTPTIPAVTVTVRGTLNLNTAAYALLGEPEAVVLGWDATLQVIGLRPAGRRERNSYLVRPLGPAGTMRTISAKLFCEWIKADLAEARRYPLTRDGGYGCVDISQPGEVVSGNRGRRR